MDTRNELRNGEDGNGPYPAVVLPDVDNIVPGLVQIVEWSWFAGIAITNPGGNYRSDMLPTVHARTCDLADMEFSRLNGSGGSAPAFFDYTNEIPGFNAIAALGDYASPGIDSVKLLQPGSPTAKCVPWVIVVDTTADLYHPLRQWDHAPLDGTLAAARAVVQAVVDVGSPNHDMMVGDLVELSYIAEYDPPSIPAPTGPWGTISAITKVSAVNGQLVTVQYTAVLEHWQYQENVNAIADNFPVNPYTERTPVRNVKLKASSIISTHSGHAVTTSVRAGNGYPGWAKPRGLGKIVLLDPGYGYSKLSPPAVTVGGGVAAVAEVDDFGRVSRIRVTNPSSGLSTAPSVAIDAPSGSGRRATATAFIADISKGEFWTVRMADRFAHDIREGDEVQMCWWENQPGYHTCVVRTGQMDFCVLARAVAVLVGNGCVTLQRGKMVRVHPELTSVLHDDFVVTLYPGPIQQRIYANNVDKDTGVLAPGTAILISMGNLDIDTLIQTSYFDQSYVRTSEGWAFRADLEDVWWGT